MRIEDYAGFFSQSESFNQQIGIVKVVNVGIHSECQIDSLATCSYHSFDSARFCPAYVDDFDTLLCFIAQSVCHNQTYVISCLRKRDALLAKNPRIVTLVNYCQMNHFRFLHTTFGLIVNYHSAS